MASYTVEYYVLFQYVICRVEVPFGCLFAAPELPPANQATNNWTQIPANWEHLRWQWEVSHAVNAVITFVGFVR